MDTLLIIAGVVVAALVISMLVKYRNKPVDMNHKAPNVHNVQMKGKVGPATAADKAAEPAKKAPAKKTTKKKATTKKKTTKKKTASKKDA
jgi:hypothetical protein